MKSATLQNVRVYSVVLLEAGGKRSTRIAVQEVYGETFEGVSIGHCPPHGVLKLLVTTGDPCAALQLIGR